MQILHLGLHKTGTTSLQKNLFQKNGVLYHGMHEPAWQSRKKAWLDFFMGQDRAPLPGGENFIYSYEATLLRCGGLDAATGIARTIAGSFNNPTVLITVREPSALLVSAYFQSLRLRRSALGFRNGRPVFQQSVRFMPFEAWWEHLIHEPGISLAGLLDYAQLRAAFETWLEPQQIVFLKLEELSGKSPGYADKLRKIGCAPAALDDFLSAPPENTGAGKKLQRERALWSWLGWRLAQRGLARPMGTALRATGLMRPAEKILYGGSVGAKRRIDERLLEEIKERFRPGFDSLV